MKPGRLPNRYSLRADIVLRAVGALLIMVAALAVHRLLLRVALDPLLRHHASTYLLAAMAFPGGSVGCGLLLLGLHIHDRVEISPLWIPADTTPYGAGQAPSIARSQTGAATAMADGPS